MDNASDYGSEDSRFDSWLARNLFDLIFIFLHFIHAQTPQALAAPKRYEKLAQPCFSLPRGAILHLVAVRRTLQRRSLEHPQSSIFWFPSPTANTEKGPQRDTRTELHIREALRKKKRRVRTKKEKDSKKGKGSAGFFTPYSHWVTLHRPPLPFRIERRVALTEEMLNPRKSRLVRTGYRSWPCTLTFRRVLVGQFQKGGGIH